MAGKVPTRGQQQHSPMHEPLIEVETQDQMVAERRRCRDPAFAGLFLANLAIIVYFAVKGVHSVQADIADDDDISETDGISLSVGMNTLVAGLFAVAAIGAALCMGWMALVMYHAESVLKCSWYWYIGSLAAMAIYCFSTLDNQGAGIFCLILLAVVLCVWRSIMRRIPFAAANLVTACAALKDHKSVICFVLLMVLLGFAWALAWVFALFGIFGNSSSSEVNGGVVFLLLVSLYWGMGVASNVNHVTVAGTVGSWWFSSPGNGDSFAVSGSFKRAMTTSFGSICYGSLLVAILESLEYMAREMQRRGGGMVACCAVCILNIVRGLVQYINRYAFSYVGLYGHDFCTAGNSVFRLFDERGFWTTVCNDNLIRYAMYLGTWVIAGLTYLAGLGVGEALAPSNSEFKVLLGSYGAIVGLSLAMITMNTILSAVDTVYVAFAESYKALMENHRDIFDRLYNTWNEFHPTLVTYIIIVPAHHVEPVPPHQAVVVQADPVYGY